MAMLHRAVELSATRLFGWDVDGAALAGRLLRGLGLAGAMFLLCRLSGTAAPAPFAMAFLSAALLAGQSAAALLAGCLAGAVTGGPAGFDLRLPIGAAIVLGGGIAWDLSEPFLRRRLAALRDGLPGRLLRRARARLRSRAARDPAPRMQARSPNPRAPALCSALAGFGVLIPGLVGLRGALWPAAATAVAGSVAAVTSAPFMRAALEGGLDRKFPEPEARVGLLLTAGLLVAGLARLATPVGLWAGGALAVLLYPGGAAAGIGAGTALLAVGGDARLFVAASAAGAAAQLCGPLSRPARAASASAAMLVAGLLLNAPTSALVSAGAAGLAVVALPEPWAGAVAKLARPAPQPCDPRRLAARLQRDSARRLYALGAAFGELAEGYRAPVKLPDEQALIQKLREKLCAGCADYARCWDGGRDGGARLLCDLIARAVAMSGEAPLFEGEGPPELARRCRRGRLIPERLQEPLEDFAAARRAELKRGSENRLASRQFDQARRLIEGLARRQGEPLKLRQRQAARAAAALERSGLAVDSVMALGGGAAEIVAALGRGCWTPDMARRAAERLARILGGRYGIAGVSGREARFEKRPRLRVETGVLCASREAGAPCGDSHLVCRMEGGRLLALICDGMGSGDGAARESATAVRLIGRLLRSSAPGDLALETVNALLLNRGGEEMFATVDMLMLDLTTGEARLTKLAACATLIARGGAVRRVEGGRLPLGILEEVRPGRCRVRLAPGDVLLMASDGVMDAAGGEVLEAMLADGPTDMPDLARRVLDAAGRAAGGHRDDMTAVCLRVASSQ